MLIKSIISFFTKQKTKNIDKCQYDKNGNRHGYWEIYHRDSYYAKGNYLNGNCVGYWEYVTIEGFLKNIIYDNQVYEN